MTHIIKKEKDNNPWLGRRFVISRKYRYIKDDTQVVSGNIPDEEIDEPVEITSQDEFQRKLSEIRSKNQFLKSLAIQENREIYAQLIIQEL